MREAPPIPTGLTLSSWRKEGRKREGKGERDGDGGNEMEGVRGREGRREGGNEGE